MKNYYSFIYLDDNSINSLYSQVFEDIAEKCITQKDETVTTATIKANIWNVLKSTIYGQERISALESVKIVISTERKAQLLIERLRGEQINIQQIIREHQPFDESVYFVGRGYFYISDIYDEDISETLFGNKVDAEIYNINSNNKFVIVLESGNTDFINRYCLDNDVSQNLEYGIMLRMSSTKMKKIFDI